MTNMALVVIGFVLIVYAVAAGLGLALDVFELELLKKVVLW